MLATTSEREDRLSAVRLAQYVMTSLDFSGAALQAAAATSATDSGLARAAVPAATAANEAFSLASAETTSRSADGLDRAILRITASVVATRAAWGACITALVAAAGNSAAGIPARAFTAALVSVASVPCTATELMASAARTA